MTEVDHSDQAIAGIYLDKTQATIGIPLSSQTTDEWRGFGQSGLIISGILWGTTNPFMEKGATTKNNMEKKGFWHFISIILSPRFILPFLLNQCGSVSFYFFQHYTGNLLKGLQTTHFVATFTPGIVVCALLLLVAVDSLKFG